MRALQALAPVGSHSSQCKLCELLHLLAHMARNASSASQPSCQLTLLASHVTLHRTGHVIPARGHPDLAVLSRGRGMLWVSIPSCFPLIVTGHQTAIRRLSSSRMLSSRLQSWVNLTQTTRQFWLVIPLDGAQVQCCSSSLMASCDLWHTCPNDISPLSATMRYMIRRC